MRSMKDLTLLYRELNEEIDELQQRAKDTSESIIIPEGASKEMKSQLNEMRSALNTYASDLISQQKDIQDAYGVTLSRFRELNKYQQNYSKNFKHLFSSNDLYNLPNQNKKGMDKEDAALLNVEELKRAKSIVQSMASDVDDVTDRFTDVISKIKEVNKLERRTESMSRRANASQYMSYQQAASFVKDRGTVEHDYNAHKEDNLTAMVKMGRDRTRLHQDIKAIENNETATQEQIDRKIAYQQEIEAIDKEFEARMELNKVLERTIANMQKYNASIQGIEVKPERGTMGGMIYERAPAIGLALGGAMGGVVGNLYHQGAGISRGMRDDEITIGQRTDTDGAHWRDGIRNGALDAGLKDRLGFTGQEMLTFQNNYLSNNGFTGMDDLNTAMQGQATFSRVSGVSASDTNQLFSTLFGTGAVSGNQVKTFQDAFIGAIKRSGMEGREKEQLQALDGILVSMSQGRTLSNDQVMNAVGLQTMLASSGTRSLQGTQGGQALTSLDQGIKGGFDDPMVRLLYGQGTEYQGVSGRWALRKQMGKGITDIENVNTMIRASEQMGGDNEFAQNEAFASLADHLNIEMSSEQIEGIMKMYRDGQLTQENLDKINKESGVVGGKTAEDRLKEYQESSAATDNQSDATTQKQAAELYDYGEVIREVNASMANMNSALYAATLAIAALGVAAVASSGMFLMSAGVRTLAAGTYGANGAQRGLFGRLPQAISGFFGGGRGGGGGGVRPPTGVPPGYTTTPGGIIVPNTGGGGTGGAAGGTRSYTTGGWFGPRNGSLPNPGPSAMNGGAAAGGTAAASGMSKFMSGAGKFLSKAALPISMLFAAGHVLGADEGEKGKATGEATGGILGGLAAGAGTGALIGTSLGPVGTAVGTIIGGIAGSIAGSGIGGWLGGMFDPDKASAAELTPEEQAKMSETAPSDNKTKEMTDKENTNTKARTEDKKTNNLQYERENLHTYEMILQRASQLLQQARSQGGIFGNNGAVGGTGTYSGGGGAPGNLTGNSNSEKIWSFFADKGMGAGAIAGIMGNLQQESGLDPNAQNANGAYGIAQWMGGRKTGLQDYASKNGLEANSLEAQLGWLWEEMQNGQNGNVNDMAGMSAAQAAEYFEKKFERSGGSAMGKRKDYADDFFNQFGNKQWSTNPGASTGKTASNVRVDSTITVNVKGDESVADKINNSKEMKAAAQRINQMIYGSNDFYSKEMKLV
jgi:hypothetical protein